MRLLLGTGVRVSVSNGTMAATCVANVSPPSLRIGQEWCISVACVLRECGMWYSEWNANERDGRQRQAIRIGEVISEKGAVAKRNKR